MQLNAKRKGKTGELEAAKKLREILSCYARRGQQYAGGPDSPDLVDAIPGVYIEVKRVEKLNIDKAMAQADRDRANDEMPLVMHRRNRGDWLMTIKADDCRFFGDCLDAMVDNGPPQEGSDYEQQIDKQADSVL